jgi:ABC-2 type transport system permease protein
MPIHDQGYRRYTGPRAPLGRAWAVIATTGVRTMFSRKPFVALMLLAWFPFFVRAVQIYAAANLPQASFLAPTPQMFRQFLEQQEVFLFFITVYAGAGLIANDRRANALQIYLSKPISRLEYVFGKLAVLMTFMLLVTWVPAIVLLIMQILFSGSFDFFVANLRLVPSITVFSIVQVVTISMAMLALSSLSNNSRYVAILYAGLIFFSQAMFGVMFALTRSAPGRLSWISMPMNLGLVGDFLFGTRLRFQAPVWAAFLVLGLLVVASGFVLEKRVRGVEIVA